jgi:hypothetical protein
VSLGLYRIVLLAECVPITIEVTKQQQQAYGVPLFFVLNNLHCSDVALSKHALEWMHCDFELYVK